jgi:uncharacterized membrane protein HdeD (DUF308 family)
MTDNFQSSAAKLTEISVSEILKKNWQWLLGLGIALTILGTVSILVATLTTLISVIFFGVFLILNGFMFIYHAVKFWWRQWGKFFLQLSIGILYVLGGFVLSFYPVHGALSLTLILALFYIFIGVYRGVLSVKQKAPGWGWMLFSSLVTLLLGIFIVFLWPAASLWVIGVFIGIDIIFVGWAFIMSALAVRATIA